MRNISLTFVSCDQITKEISESHKEATKNKGQTASTALSSGNGYIQIATEKQVSLKSHMIIFTGHNNLKLITQRIIYRLLGYN